MNREEILLIPQKYKQLRRKELRLEYLRAKVEGAQAITTEERVQTSPTVSMAMVDAAVDLEMEIRRDRDELKSLQRGARAEIDKLDGEDKEIMSLRYLRGLTWSEVACVVAYDVRTCLRKHQRFLAGL